MLTTLPNELLDDIYSRLTIDDCNMIRRSSDEERLQKCFYKRISISSYFSPGSFDAERMIYTMTLTGVALVGPMALNFFVPGVVIDAPTWMFFAPPCSRKRETFLRSMEAQGVVWDDPLDALNRLRDDDVCTGLPPRRKFQMSRRQFCRAARLSGETDLMSIGKDFQQNSAAMVAAQHWDNTWEYRLTEEDILEPKDPEWQVLHGKIQLGSRLQAVELVHGNLHGTLETYLAELPWTCCQCFINGFGAVHMYGKLTAEGRCHAWKYSDLQSNARQNRWTNEIDINKFKYVNEDRASRKDSSWSFLSSSKEERKRFNETRDSLDCQAIFIQSKRHSRWPEEQYHSAALTSCLLRWQEYETRLEMKTRHAVQPLYGLSTQESEAFRHEHLPTACDEEYLAGLGVQ